LDVLFFNNPLCIFFTKKTEWSAVARL